MCSGQILLRRDPNTFALHLVGDNSVARWYCIAGVEYDLALKGAAVISTELRQRAIRNSEKERIAKGDRLGHGTILGEWSEPGHQVLELLRMARREQHGVADLNPQAANRPTDMARTDDADSQLVATGLREDR